MGAMAAQDRIRDDEADKLVRRAAAAYLADPSTAGQPWPDGAESDMERHGGLAYVVLRGGRGAKVLAVYRVRRGRGGAGTGQLKRLERPPAGLE